MRRRVATARSRQTRVAASCAATVGGARSAQAVAAAEPRASRRVRQCERATATGLIESCVAGEAAVQPPRARRRGHAPAAAHELAGERGHQQGERTAAAAGVELARASGSGHGELRLLGSRAEETTQPSNAMLTR
ncbi:hypothetical protein SEVIR_5G012101v4 [Setaria viridis]